MSYLIGDVGGTNCRLARWEDGRLLNIEVWSTETVHTLTDVVALYMDKHPFTPEASCVAVAGPIQDGITRLTNTNWSGAAADLPGPGRLINDLHAAARGIGRLTHDDVAWIGPPPERIDPDANIAVMGVGTGIGMALRIGGHVVPTEGGHADFAPANPRQDELLQWLRTQHVRVTLENVAAGPGMRRLLDFVAQDIPLDTYTLKQLETEPAAKVVFACADQDPACAETMDLFLSIVGSEVGNLALRCLPDGGVFLAGGVLPRIVDTITDGRFRAAFENKAPMAALLKDMPLGLVTYPYLGLLGAVVEAERLLNV
ncbi:MAG: glucokinase [Myxococcota bacterium]